MLCHTVIHLAALLNRENNCYHLPNSHCFYNAKGSFLFEELFNFKAYFTNYKDNTRHVCTYLNAFLMVIPNIVITF